jgi:S-DNA-T family DNA segregation ATPase FtsK/SpoIIIE
VAASKGQRPTSRPRADKAKRPAPSTRVVKTTRKAPSARGRQEPSPHSREVYGISLIAGAIVLSVALALGSEGVLVRTVADVLKFAVGIGAYLLPVLLAGWGITFFFSATTWRETRVALGLGIVLLAVVGLAHMSVPASRVFDNRLYAANGGVVGASLTYAFKGLLGVSGAYVVLIAAAIAGLVTTSLFSVADTVAAAWARLVELFAAEDEGEAPAKGPGGRPEKTRRIVPREPGEERPARREPSFAAGGDAKASEATVQLPLTDVPEGEGYHRPPLTLLKRTKERPRGAQRSIEEYKRLLLQTLADFDVEATVDDAIVGPTVTLFEVQPAPGVSVGRIMGLSRDIGLALATNDVRIAPIPGKAALGVEVPNEARDLVTVGDVLSTTEAAAATSVLEIALGKDTSGNPILADLGDMPHLLIAGATGQGKSVCINAILVTLLMRTTPSQVKLILIDPKRIELAAYRDLPHLLVPVVVEPKKAANALAWAVVEMEQRYKQLEKVGAKKLEQYNALVAAAKDPRTEGMEELPFIVVVIDELADLMMISSVEVEGTVQRLSQMARAVGIHLVLATQRPSTDVITGLIKANITTRIAMKVGSSIDSRVILDSTGAEKLVGKGDMLLMQPERGKALRVQGAYVSEEEIDQIAAFIKAQATPEYHEEITENPGLGGDLECDDPMLERAIQVVLMSQMGSTSMLQRRLRLGYTRAARLMDMMEQLGIVGAPDGSKPREVLMDEETWEIVRGEAGGDGGSHSVDDLLEED